jgi:hypothetical protein
MPQLWVSRRASLVTLCHVMPDHAFDIARAGWNEARVDRGTRFALRERAQPCGEML